MEAQEHPSLNEGMRSENSEAKHAWGIARQKRLEKRGRSVRPAVDTNGLMTMAGAVKYREAVPFVLLLRQQRVLTTSCGSADDFEPRACNTFGAEGSILEDTQMHPAAVTTSTGVCSHFCAKLQGQRCTHENFVQPRNLSQERKKNRALIAVFCMVYA